MATCATSPPEAGLKERFFQHFQDQVQILQTQVHSLEHASGGGRNESIDHCLAGIDQLSREVKDASSYIPAYDQRAYSQTIKALSDSLRSARESLHPPKKFSFKARKAASVAPVTDSAPGTRAHLSSPSAPWLHALESGAPSIPTRDAQQSLLIDTTDTHTTAESSHGTGIRRPSFSRTDQVTISGCSDLHIVPPASASRTTRSGTLSHLAHCIVDLSAATADNTPFAALYLKNIKDSLIICGQVAGAIHITNMVNSVLVTACRQFRMHGSKNVDVYLHASSRPIFEECQGLRFAPLPEPYLTHAIAELPNQWDQIDDFTWLKPDPSPHFSILAEDKRCDERVWRSKVMDAKDGDLNDILQAIHPTTARQL